MATGRTISASFLTESDKHIISLCENISKIIEEHIKGQEYKKSFKKNYGKISYTRDSGVGRGAGKLQRDAMCTRGRGGKAPFSNRNLRWHPLVVAENLFDYATEIERIDLEGEDESQTLIFIITDHEGNEIPFPSDRVHELPQRYVILPKHWIPHVERLKHWNDNLWTQNSCVIPALEACEWWNSVETYAVLGMAIALDFFGVDFDSVYSDILDVLKEQEVDNNIILPSANFPKVSGEIANCAMCKTSISKNPANLESRERVPTWQPAWRGKKRSEGDDASTQIMHVQPLIENELRHNVVNVRYGHRWCNVSMTDHSVDETLDFMEYIVKVHNRCS